MDAAKAMRLFHESPQLSIRELSLPFLDARKRIADFPQIDHKVRLVAIPTTSGTGSEVSPAAVISVGKRKVTLVDYSLVPDMAIVDPNLTLTMPQEITADTGIDALTHALEAAVSIFASPFTDAFCMQAANLIFTALPRAYRDGSDLEARTAMANAATIAGLAFSNAFVGLNHALAHAVGARFGIAHGRANAIFLPARAALQRVAAEQVHAGARLLRVRRAREVRADRVDPRASAARTEQDRRERLFARVDELLARGRGAADAGRLRREPPGVRGGAARPRQGGVHGPEHPHQPAHPDDSRGRSSCSRRATPARPDAGRRDRC